MKKTLIGIGAVAMLTASPAVAGYASDSAWDVVNNSTTTGKQLVLVGGLADDLDACGNGKPFYTVFMPIDVALDAYLDEADTSVAELSSNPSAVTALLNDHIARGSVSPAELVNPSVTVLVAKSGFRLTKTVTDSVDALVEEGEVYIAGRQVIGYTQACNGWVYWLNGTVDSTTQVPTVGVDTSTPPTSAPVESALPNTL